MGPAFSHWGFLTLSFTVNRSKKKKQKKNFQTLLRHYHPKEAEIHCAVRCFHAIHTVAGQREAQPGKTTQNLGYICPPKGLPQRGQSP